MLPSLPHPPLSPSPTRSRFRTSALSTQHTDSLPPKHTLCTHSHAHSLCPWLSTLLSSNVAASLLISMCFSSDQHVLTPHLLQACMESHTSVTPGRVRAWGCLRVNTCPIYSHCQAGMQYRVRGRGARVCECTPCRQARLDTTPLQRFRPCKSGSY